MTTDATDTPMTVTHPADPATEPATEPASATPRARRPRRVRRWLQRRADRRATRRAVKRIDRDAADWSTRLDTVDWTRWYPALMAFVGGVVVITFAMSYHGLYAFADEIAHLPGLLTVIAPLGVDVFSLCCLTATFLLRDAPRRVRAYSWAMFALTVAISVAGNGVYAISDVERRAGVGVDRLGWGYQQVSAVIGTAVWPVFAAGALHLLIIGRRHLERQRDSVRHAQAEAVRAAEAEQLLRAQAIELAAAGASASAIRSELGLPVEKQRTVERWTKPIRDALDAARTPAPVRAATRTPARGRVTTNVTAGNVPAVE